MIKYNALLWFISIAVFGPTTTASVCLLSKQDEPLKLSQLTEQSTYHPSIVQLKNHTGQLLLSNHTLRFPLSLVLQMSTTTDLCFSDPFYLINTSNQYQWINAKGEIFYEVYWFDNGPDYPADGLFRFIDNELIGSADVQNFETVIPGQFKIASPFKDNKASVFLTGESVEKRKANDNNSDIWRNNFLTIDKHGRVIDD